MSFENRNAQPFRKTVHFFFHLSPFWFHDPRCGCCILRHRSAGKTQFGPALISFAAAAPFMSGAAAVYFGVYSAGTSITMSEVGKVQHGWM